MHGATLNFLCIYGQDAVRSQELQKVCYVIERSTMQHISLPS